MPIPKGMLLEILDFNQCMHNLILNEEQKHFHEFLKQIVRF